MYADDAKAMSIPADPFAEMIEDDRPFGSTLPPVLAHIDKQLSLLAGAVETLTVKLGPITDQRPRDAGDAANATPEPMPPCELIGSAREIASRISGLRWRLDDLTERVCL